LFKYIRNFKYNNSNSKKYISNSCDDNEQMGVISQAFRHFRMPHSQRLDCEIAWREYVYHVRSRLKQKNKNSLAIKNKSLNINKKSTYIRNSDIYNTSCALLQQIVNKPVPKRDRLRHLLGHIAPERHRQQNTMLILEQQLPVHSLELILLQTHALQYPERAAPAIRAHLRQAVARDLQIPTNEVHSYRSYVVLHHETARPDDVLLLLELGEAGYAVVLLHFVKI
jgi:hypothetical protein